MKISSYNEWSPLKEVVVGEASFANWPTDDPVFAKESEKTLWKETPVPSGPVPQWIIDEANEDLDILADTLKDLGVKVHRPGQMNFQKLGGMYNYCPRDRLLIAGDEVVDCSMMYPCRNMENAAYGFVFDRAANVRDMPKDQGMVFDAANISRLGDTWLYLMSHSGNEEALNWLRDTFGNKFKIEVCNFYSGVHIDSTIVPIREGLVFLNASRVNEGNCPAVFKNWKKVYIKDEDIVEQSFYKYPYASKWIALNFLMVNPHLAIVDAAQEKLIKILKENGVDSIALNLRHSRTLGGGFHCVTLDLVRR